jgi:transglutaminase-like putative cysteine protease
VTAGAPTTYDKVLALEGWMAANTRYTRDIPPLPAGADAVDQFLFVDKRGFCEQIGTSLAVMLRSIGVPARLAVGFAPGTESLLGGTFTVHAGDAHAWVEVWFPQIGWQAFDPTAHVPLAGESHSTLGTRLGHLLRQLLPWLLAVAGVLAAVGLWFAGRALARRRRVRHERPWVVGYYRRLGALGAKRGRPPSPSETPLEYGAALGDVLDDDRFAEIAEILNRAAYDRAPPAPSQQAWAEEVLATHR